MLPSVKLAFRWGAFVIASHWKLFLALVLVSFVVQIPFWAQGALLPSLLLVVLYLLNALGLIALVLVTHNEVLQGPSRLDAATLGRRGARIVAYFFDVIAASLLIAMSVILLALIVVLLGIILREVALPESLRAVLLGALYLALFIAYVGVASRLILRLPSRAIGQPLRWGLVWALGRSNTFRLIGANVLLFLTFAVPAIGLLLLAFVLMGNDVSHFQDLLGQFAKQHYRGGELALTGNPLLVMALLAALNALLTPTELVVFAALYSIAYARLIGNLQDEPEGLVNA